MMERTIFSERIDYLLMAATAALTFWAFYGTRAAVVAAIVVVAVANLQPVRRQGVSRNSAALLTISMLLVLSVGLKIIDRDGYCYALLGPQRQMVDFINLEMPCFGTNDFYSDTDQPGGLGYVRDIGLPLIGLTLGLIVTRNLRKERSDA